MRRILLDTSAYSAFFRGHPRIVRAVQGADELHLDPVVIGELLSGFRAGSREKRNRDELDGFLASRRVQVLEITEETSARYAIIVDELKKSGCPIPTNDVCYVACPMAVCYVACPMAVDLGFRCSLNDSSRAAGR
ncbi:MAG: type II toxin-antitoxin system VapC family toxin [Candidatus Schekmanbacteria bacterium]|nr:type II toxin-antitoxin system VapC family toxin [Candidatus Schekmanbacteria bacterium]